MKDIDFDELDKAISSALVPGQSASPAPAPAEKPAAKPALSTESEPVANDKTVLSVKTNARPQPATASSRPLVAPRHSINRGGNNGALIDVMAPTQPAVSRKAPSLAPPPTRPHADIAPKVEARTSISEITADEPKPAAAKPATASGQADNFTRFDSLSRSGITFDPPAAEPQPSENLPVLSGLNDPDLNLEEEALRPASKATPAEQPSVEPAPVLAVVEPAVADPEPVAEAPASPFLEGAKVEKRPLGSLREPETEVADLDQRLAQASASEVGQPLSIHDQPTPGTAGVQGHAPFDTNDYHAPIAAPAAPAAPAAAAPAHSNTTLLISIVIFVLALIMAGAIIFFGDELRNLVQ